MTNEEADNILRQPIRVYEETKKIRRLKAEEFIFSYLIQNNKKGKVDELTLKINGFNFGLDSFLSDIKFYTNNHIINIVEVNNKYVKLELTLSGKAFYESKEKQKVIVPSKYFRVRLLIIKVFKRIWNFFYITVNKKLLQFFKSGYWLLSVPIIGFIYFVLPYIHSINESNNKQKDTLNVQPIKEELPLKESSKKESELLVLSKDSVIQEKDSLLLKKN